MPSTIWASHAEDGGFTNGPYLTRGEAVEEFGEGGSKRIFTADENHGMRFGILVDDVFDDYRDELLDEGIGQFGDPEILFAPTIAQANELQNEIDAVVERWILKHGLEEPFRELGCLVMDVQEHPAKGKR